MGRTPFAGVAWQVLHYLEGFRRLGCNVYYVEDTADWPYDPEQIEIAQGRKFTVDLLSAHTHHLTYGENFGAPDCGVPLGRFDYRPTRQPIVLDWWTSVDCRPHNGSRRPPAAGSFTTISSWQQSGKDIEWRGEMDFGSKHLEFLKFIDLPRHVKVPLELALACEDP